jgi:hypothetical protein
LAGQRLLDEVLVKAALLRFLRAAHALAEFGQDLAGEDSLDRLAGRLELRALGGAGQAGRAHPAGKQVGREDRRDR